MISTSAHLDAALSTQTVTRMVDMSFAPFVRPAGRSEALTSAEAMRILSDATADIRWYEIYFEQMIENLPPSDEALAALSGADAERLYEKYSSAAAFLSAHLRQLKIMFTMGEALPEWAPHATLLRSYSNRLYRAFASIRNVYESTASSLKQVYHHNPVETTFSANPADVREALRISHNITGLSPRS